MDFVTSAVCVETDDDSDAQATDSEQPGFQVVFYYLVRAENVFGIGSLGEDSSGSPRAGRDCP